jgi:hypothetical protein
MLEYPGQWFLTWQAGFKRAADLAELSGKDVVVDPKSAVQQFILEFRQSALQTVSNFTRLPYVFIRLA